MKSWDNKDTIEIVTFNSQEKVQEFLIYFDLVANTQRNMMDFYFMCISW